MKNIAKQTLLLGALALLSSMPMQAMESAPADVQQEVTTKRGFFTGWTEKARNLRLRNSMKELDVAWKPFIKCVTKGDKDCSAESRTIRRILGSILALVGVGTAIAIRRRLTRKTSAVTEEPSDEPVYGRLEEEEIVKAGEVFEGVTMPEAWPEY